jgi:hypothetical protein
MVIADSWRRISTPLRFDPIGPWTQTPIVETLGEFPKSGPSPTRRGVIKPALGKQALRESVRDKTDRL